MKKALLWIIDRTTGTYIALFFLVLFGGGAGAASITSWDVDNVPQTFLHASITSSQTVNIRLSPPVRNGNSVTFPTTTGGILRLRQGSKVEDIYYASGAVNAVSKIVTLYGVIRDVCFNQPRAIVGCGDGQSFSKGAIVELTVDSRLLNLKANIDRKNIFTASGAIAFSGSGTLGLRVYANAAERSIQDPNPGTGGQSHVSCLLDTGLCYYFLGGAWNPINGAGTSNASDTVAGKVQIITLANQGTLTATGSTGAQNVLTPRWLTKNSSGSSVANRIPLLNSLGLYGIGFGGTGRSTFLTGSLLVGQGTLGFTRIAPGSANQVLVSDGTRWAPGSMPQEVTLLGSSGTYIQNGSPPSTNYINSASTIVFTGSLKNIPANTFTATGQVLKVRAFGYTRSKASSAGTWQLGMKCGSQHIFTGALVTLTDNVDNQAWVMDVDIMILNPGVDGVTHVSGTIDYEGATQKQYIVGSFDRRGAETSGSWNTTVGCNLGVFSDFGTSDPSNNAGIIGWTYYLNKNL